MAKRHFGSLVQRRRAAPKPGPQPQPQRGDLLFVYGTLRRRGIMFGALGLHGRVAPAGPASMRGALVSFGSYPGVLSGARGIVHGELYRVLDARVFAALDAYEECFTDDAACSLFWRMRAPLSARRVGAWVYVYNGRRKGAAVPCGRWRP